MGPAPDHGGEPGTGGTGGTNQAVKETNTLNQLLADLLMDNAALRLDLPCEDGARGPPENLPQPPLDLSPLEPTTIRRLEVSQSVAPLPAKLTNLNPK